MYYPTETNAITSKKYNTAMKEDARKRLTRNRILAHKTKRDHVEQKGKAFDKLTSRIADHTRLLADDKHDAKVQTRIGSGGFHRPGSMQF